MMQASATPWPSSSSSTTSGGSFVHVPLRPEFQRTPRSDVLSVGFNQNYSLLLIGTEAGFKVYHADTLQEYMRREAPGRGLAMVEILHKTNVLALVGGGKNPKYPLNKVMLYSNAEDRCFGELAFRSAIRAVKLLPNYVVVVLEFKVYVYDFELKLVYQFETLSNIPGVVATTSPSFADPSASVLACLSHQRTGEVRIKRFNKRGSYHVQAHDETISCLALNTSGSLLATASTKGTLVNIFRTSDGTKLQELHRGGDPATIYSMAFSVNSQFLAVSSSKETVHVFSIKAEESNSGTKLMASESGSRRLFKAGSMLLSSAAATAGSSFSFVKGMMPKLFISERSLCQFRLPKQSRAKVGFGIEKNTILVACTDGSLYKCSFDPVKGGPCRLQQDFYFP